MKCPCGTGREFYDCCEKFLKDTAKPVTAEELMRARYSAFVVGDFGYIRKTLAKSAQKQFDLAATKKWSQESEWLGLTIISSTLGQPTDSSGTVEFMAKYKQHGEVLDHHEVSKFKKENGEWKFVDSDSHVHREGEHHDHHHHHVEPMRREMPKIGRNDPCPCGSGKKYKKCHGAV